jgi:pyoverdine/dityrosine biosynthesis protein Dit1
MEITNMQNDKIDLEVDGFCLENLLSDLHEHITSADNNSALQEVIHIESIRRKYDFEDTIISLNKNQPSDIEQSERITRIHKTATEILHRLAPHRRLLPQTDVDSHTMYEEYIKLHLPKVSEFVAANKPIHLILPAFPAKSPNTITKVLGKLPDMAEEQALFYLQRVCNDIEACYSPGAKITICSDGRVFSDLVQVEDDDVTTYGQAITQMIDRFSLRSIDIFNMEDVFTGMTFDEMRDYVSVHYAESLDKLREQMDSQPQLRVMYNGIHRFLIEDALVLEPSKSKNKIKKECGSRAYGVIQRSNAWTRLIAECFPKALRLSIHPQRPDSEKIGILLGDAEDGWMTPWHSVAVKEGERFRFMKRSQAEELGAKLVELDGRPSHYCIETTWNWQTGSTYYSTSSSTNEHLTKFHK